MSKRNIILPIKSKYFDLIISGKKKYEYRKNKFKYEIDIIYFYITSPVQAVVGSCECANILFDSIENIWKLTQFEAGLHKDEYFDYFKKSKKACAINIRNLQLFNEQKKISEICSKKSPPQNFFYIG